MLSPSELTQFFRICTKIADAASNSSDQFVPVNQLLKQFSARLVRRPLLVEGMIASQEPVEGIDPTIKWTVLVDAGKYSFTESEVNNESSLCPLPERLRFTVAHELAHTLAFAHTEYNVKLSKQYAKRRDEKFLVESIETETDKLSPLLLICNSALSALSAKKQESLNLDELVLFRKRNGVSRYAFINRLCLLKDHDPSDILQRPAFRNIALAMGSYDSVGTPFLHKWPLFHNFDRNIVPEHVFTISKAVRTNLNELLPDSLSRDLTASSALEDICVKAGAFGTSVRESMNVEISIERTSKSEGRTFLFLIRKV